MKSIAQKNSKKIRVGDISVDLVRKRMKNIRITVQPDGSVTVSAPFGASENDIVGFISSKSEWIAKHTALAAERKRRTDELGDHGKYLVLFGRVYRLVRTAGERRGIELKGTDAVLTLPVGAPDDAVGKITEAFRREALSQKISQLLPDWEIKTGLFCNEWRIKKMKTRWGTCNTSAKRIWFSLMLSEKPTECIEYVIMHELLHLRFPDHGAGFRAASDIYMPGWREIRKSMIGLPEGMGDSDD